MDIVAIAITIGGGIIIGCLAYIFYKKVYIGVAEYFVRTRPNKVSKVINQTSAISERGGVPTILVLGSDLMVTGYDFAKVEPEDTEFRVAPRIPNDTFQHGGFRTGFASLFNGYIRHITGYETNVQAFRDLFTKDVTFLRYDLKRPILKKKAWKGKEGELVEWWDMEFRKDDFTTQIRHNREAFDFVIPPIDTGKLMETVDASGAKSESPQRIPVSLKCQVFLRVDDPMKAIYKTGKNYLGFVLNIIISEMRDVIQGMGYDDLLKLESRKIIVDNVKQGVTRNNVRVTEGIYQKLLKEIGIDIIDIQIEDIFITDDNMRISVQQQGKELVEGQAKITRAQFAFEESKLVRARDEELAAGLAAYPAKRLGGIAAGGKELLGLLRDHKLTRDVLVADLHSDGVKHAKNGTIFVNAGGLDRGPMPVIPFTSSGDDNKGGAT